MAYAPVDELARVLQITAPTAAQVTAMQRALDGASFEIDQYLAPDAPYADPVPALVVEVCVERSVEHWKQTQSPFGIVVLAGDAPPAYARRASWMPHANKLLPLKHSFGLA